jgi:hypothetical protein
VGVEFHTKLAPLRFTNPVPAVGTPSQVVEEMAKVMRNPSADMDRTLVEGRADSAGDRVSQNAAFVAAPLCRRSRS